MRGVLDNRKQGFTLIEMSMVIMIIGIAIAAAGPLYSSHMKKQALQKTQDNIQVVSNAIGNFRTLYGRYPCPASLTDARNVATYGHEPALPRCADTTQAIGTCVNGVCIQQSVRDIDPGAGVDRPRVRFGWIPFRELNIPEEMAFDSYGNRLTYAVTERLAVDTTFAIDQGGIEVLNDTGATALGADANASGSAHFMLFSHGRNGSGAYTKEGVQLPCPAAGSMEERNTTCIIATTPVASTQSIFRTVRANEDTTNIQFDDQVTYFTNEEVPLWQTSTVNQLDIHVKTTAQVGVHMGAASNIDAADTLLISGDIQVNDDPATVPGATPTCNDREGCLMTDQICDQSAVPKCFSSKLIAGDMTVAGEGLECPSDDPDGAGQYMVAIQDGHPVCEDDFVVAMCPPGEIMTGVQADGTLVCSGPLGSCPEQEVPNCAGSYQTPALMLPASVIGAMRSVSSGISMTRNYRCMADGTWSYQSATGNCNCTPLPNNVVPSACGTGYTGTQQVTYAWDCSNGYGQWVYQSTDRTACVCDATTPPRTETWSCPSGFNNGRRYMRQDWSCVTQSWSSMYETSNDCSCSPTFYTTLDACTGNLTGTGIAGRRDFTCPGGAGSPGLWGSWYITSSNCNCVNGRTETWRDYNGCPTGEAGWVEMQRVLSCPSATFGPDTPTGVQDCEPIPPQTCTWKTSGSGNTNQVVEVGVPAGHSCACGVDSVAACYTGFGPYTNYAGCTCVSGGT